MFYQISLLLLLLAARTATVDSYEFIYTDSIDEQNHLWGKFKSDYSKAYESPAEEKHRFETFLQTLKHTDHLNQEALSMGGNAVFGITKFSDLSPDEFKRMYLSSSPSNSSAKVNFKALGEIQAFNIKSSDWTGKYTTEVKNQGECGSCWALAATAQIESDAIRTLGWDRNTPLSAAQLTDCAPAEKNPSTGHKNGCLGGKTVDAWTYAMNGIATDASYSYNEDNNYYYRCSKKCQSKQCREVPTNNMIRVKRFRSIDSEDMMGRYVSKQGPMTVVIDGTNLKSYGNDFPYVPCVRVPPKIELGHYVQIVGLNMEAKPPYWIVRNTWGSNWGHNGFFKMEYNVGCLGLLAQDQRAYIVEVEHYTNRSMSESSTACATVNEGSVATITCSSGTFVMAIEFASYGTPTGSCGVFSKNPNCDSVNSMSVVADVCLNKATCTVAAQNGIFFGDPCHGTGKRLYIQATCGLSEDPTAQMVPLFRYYQVGGFDHLYTTNVSEIGTTTPGAIGRYNYKFEEIAGYVSLVPTVFMVPLYRYLNNNGDHLYTIDEDEIGTITPGVTGRYNYKFEEIAGYVYPARTAQMVPLYRYLNYGLGDHLYTINSGEIGTTTLGVTGNNGYVSEGIACYLSSGVVFATVDEGSVASIFCPSSTFVRSINFASYGTPTGSCGAFSKNASCDSSYSMPVVKGECLNKAACTISAQNSVFGDPCPGTPKRLYIQAVCAVTPSTVCATAIEGSVARISCPTGSFVRAINFASYGTPLGATALYCGAFSKGSCDSINSMSVVTSACLNKATCTVSANNNVFKADPCHGTPKNLYIEAVCNPTPLSVCAMVNEGSVATITCPIINTIVKTIDFASYGTPTGSCGAFSKGSCDATTSMQVISDICLNRDICQLPVLNAVFRYDPCGIPKRLYIQATCGL